MSPQKFIKMRGSLAARMVAEAAGTNLAYFRHIAYGHRRPSVELAMALVEASNGEMGLDEILTAKPLGKRRKAFNRLHKSEDGQE